MALLNNPLLYGLYNERTNSDVLSVQIHLTAQCDQNCRHCYLHEGDTYKLLLDNQLPLNTFLKLIDEAGEYAAGKNKGVGFFFTGGDPLLYDGLWEVLDYVRKKYPAAEIAIMGNPFHVTKEVARAFRILKVQGYQVSLDGLEETHDYIRKKGSFSDAMRAVRILHSEGVGAHVMFTVSKLNCNEFLPLFRYLDKEGCVDCLGLERMVPVGNGHRIQDSVFTPEEYREFLYSVFSFLVYEKPSLNLHVKDNLWKLLLSELGIINPTDPDARTSNCGCLAAQCANIFPDGTVYACPRIPVHAGKYPEQSFAELYDNSPFLKEVRSYEKYEACSKCELLRYCRGCIGSSLAASGSIYAKDPYCWKK